MLFNIFMENPPNMWLQHTIVNPYFVRGGYNILIFL